MRYRGPKGALIGAILALAVACGDDGPTAPTPGTLVISLVTPNADDGAMLFTLAGGTIEDPRPIDGAHTFFFRRDGTSAIVALCVGDLAAGPLIEFDVPDIGKASSYSATVTEVAGTSFDLRASLSGYSLRVELGEPDS